MDVQNTNNKQLLYDAGKNFLRGFLQNQFILPKILKLSKKIYNSGFNYIWTDGIKLLIKSDMSKTISRPKMHQLIIPFQLYIIR